MPIYEVTLHLITEKNGKIKIEADNEDEAREKADKAFMDDDDNLHWDSDTVEWDLHIVNVELVSSRTKREEFIDEMKRGARKYNQEKEDEIEKLMRMYPSSRWRR